MNLGCILLFLSLFSSMLAYEECGTSYNFEHKTSRLIIKNQNMIGDWPWIVAMHANGQKICTGFIISSKFVLTAAHCYVEVKLKIRDAHFSIHAGTVFENEGEVVEVKTGFIFDQSYSQNITNDIAILEVWFIFFKHKMLDFLA